MKNGHDNDAQRGRRPTRKVDPEEQGDLLAEAVTGFFSFPASEETTEDARLKEQPLLSANKGAEESPSVLEPAATEGGETPSIPDSPWEQKMAWAKQRAREGRLEEAEELYRELVEEDPTNPRALNNLGILLDEMGDHEGAVAQLRKARQVDPKNMEVLGNFGAALGALGKYGEAEDALRHAFRLDPTNLEIRANLGILLFRRGLYEQAVSELEVVCRNNPDNGHPFFYMGEALNRLGRVDEAVEALEKVIELIPGNSKAYYTLGVLFDKKNEPEKAATMYRKARESRGR